jgi:hypothetical protein
MGTVRIRGMHTYVNRMHTKCMGECMACHLEIDSFSNEISVLLQKIPLGALMKPKIVPQTIAVFPVHFIGPP